MSADPSCPRCRNALFAGQIGHLAALGCGACGGLWLDNATTTAVLRRFDIDASRLARLVDGKTAAHSVASPFARATGACPVCGGALATAAHAGVTLDFCEPHGTFFDHGELAHVLAAAAPVAAPALAPAAPSIEQIRTEVRHDLAWQRDALGTQLMDWMTGGKDWVNRWRD